MNYSIYIGDWSFSRFLARAILIALALTVLGCSKSDSQNSGGDASAQARGADDDETYPDFQEPDVVQSSVSFYGWLGDSAILVEEVYTEDDSSYAEYYIYRPGEGEMELLDISDSLFEQPDAIRGGIEVAPLHGMDPKQPFIELYLNYDSAALAAVQAELDSVELGSELPEPVGGLVGVIWHQPDVSVDTLWLDSVYVGPYYGDSAVEYHLPEITYAEMSPSRRSLMVALWLNDYIEYFVFDLTELKK